METYFYFLSLLMRTLYLLRCADSSLYTGITTDLTRRIEEHNSSPLGAKYTKARRPVELVRSQSVEDRSVASSLELQLKKLTKTQKEALITNATILDCPVRT